MLAVATFPWRRDPLYHIADEADEHRSLDAADLILTQASRQQQELIWARNSAYAEPVMTAADYVSRERMLAEHDSSKEGRRTQWVLCPRDRPTEIVASCEITRKTALIAENGTYRLGSACAIAKIHTNPAFCGLGMAALMMRRVQDVVDRNSDFSILYSDIGKNWYGSLGWAAFPSQQATIHLIQSADRTMFPTKRPDGTKYLEDNAIQALCEQDVQTADAKFDGLGADGKTHVAIRPDFAQTSWQLTRSGFMTAKVHGHTDFHRGAITDDGTTWVFWDHRWQDNELRILRVGTKSDGHNRLVENTKLLLETALAEANARGLRKISMWNPDDASVSACKAVGDVHESAVMVVFDERLNKGVPSLRWNGAAKNGHEIVWEDNSFNFWC